MRAIVTARLDTARPALVLTRSAVLGKRRWVTMAPITSTVRGLPSTVPVGPRNGLDHDSVVQCDSIATIPADRLRDTIGLLFDDQEAALARAIADAFDLTLDPEVWS